MGRDTIQLENAVSTISHEYLMEFTPEYGIRESLHPELLDPEDPIVEFPEGKVDMDLFSFISAPNPAKVKTRTRPRAAHEVPLLTATSNRIIDIEDMTGASGSSGTPSTVEKSPLDFLNEDAPSLITESIRPEEQRKDELSQGAAPVRNPPHTGVTSEPDLEKETVDTGALVSKRRCKRGPDEAKANAPPKVLRKDYVAFHPSQGTLGGKSLASMGIRTGTTVSAPATQEIPVHTEGVSDPDLLSYSKLRPAPEQDVASIDKLPMSISKDLKVDEKEALLKEDYKPAVQIQRRVNPKIHESRKIPYSLKVDRAKVDVIAKIPHPTTVKGVRSFLGHTGFYRRFIYDFSKIVRPMTHLFEKETPFVFSKDCINAFETLKKKLTEAPILVVPDWNLPFKRMCDASDFGIGVVLGQRKTKHF
uniref:Reverse transcriptase domain-containing protein n=1 Tax=Tanacetum cinerariifolium TaxID=118510 RepID=A0A6L2P3P1_TANCI|nr:reverse transcriptase domain-containing protein [Tanacetum cinerariifolium]